MTELKLITTQDEYIKLLEKAIGDAAVFLYMHGITTSDTDVQKGIKLRGEISKLKNDINYIDPIKIDDEIILDDRKYVTTIVPDNMKIMEIGLDLVKPKK